MLLQQLVAHAEALIELVAIVEHVVAQQFAEDAHDMQQHDIVRGFVDELMQVGVGGGFLRGVVEFVGLFDPQAAFAECGAIDIGRPNGRKRRRLSFDHAAIFEIVRRDALLVAEKLGERAAERREEFGDDRAGLGRLDQTARLELVERLAQGRAGHVELLRELAFGGEFLAGPQHAFENQLLEVVGYRVAQFGRSNHLVS